MQPKELKVGVILSYVYIALKSIIELIYTPIMLRILGQSEYGMYSLVNSVVGYLGLLTFGVGGAYLRFYSREKVSGNEERVAKLNGMFTLLFSGTAVVAFLSGMALSQNLSAVLGSKLSADELNTASFMVVLLSVSMGLTILNSVFSSYISACERYLFQRGLNIAACILNPFLSLPLLLMGFGSVSLVLVTLLITILTLVVNIWVCIRRLKMRICIHGLDWGLLKEIYAFSFFFFLNQAIDQINWSTDSILLGRFWGTTMVAVYGLASQINRVYLQFSAAISSVFAPRINRIVAEGCDVNQKLLTLMISVGRIQGLILLLLLMGLIMLGKPFLYWIGGSEAYLGSYPVMLLLIVPVTVPLVQNLGIEIQRAENKHQFRSIVYAGMAILNVLISLALISRFGAVGTATGTAISLVIANGFIMNWYYHSHLGLDMKKFWTAMKSLAQGAILPVIYCAVCMRFTNAFRPVTFLLSGGGLVLIYTLSMWRWGMNDYEKQLILKPIYRLCH